MNDSMRLLGADRAAGQRRLDEVVTGRGEPRAELAHDLGTVGRQVDEHRTRRRGGRPLVGDRRTTSASGSDSTVTSLAAPTSPTDVTAACTGDRLGPRRVDVEHDDVVAVGDEVGRDVATDVAQPDDADLHLVPPRMWGSAPEPGARTVPRGARAASKG